MPSRENPRRGERAPEGEGAHHVVRQRLRQGDGPDLRQATHEGTRTKPRWGAWASTRSAVAARSLRVAWASGGAHPLPPGRHRRAVRGPRRITVTPTLTWLAVSAASYTL
jgi:hypothetical protein